MTGENANYTEEDEDCYTNCANWRERDQERRVPTGLGGGQDS